jgi:S1/P1 Nuclease
MKKLVFYLALSFITLQGFSWGATGHRVTGYIAEQNLNGKARNRIKEILGQETLWMASTWMDEVRSDSLYNYATDWHFVTILQGTTYAQSTKSTKGDIIMSIERIIKELKSHSLTHQQEVEHIRMLVHLIGDIHQPLHVGLYDDQGGNKVKLKWFGRDTNLHTLWDSGIIDDTKLSFTEFSQSLPKPDKTVLKTLQGAALMDWVSESLSEEAQVYKIGDGNLGYKYGYQNLPLIRQKLNEAGIRIAGVLNEIYG